ncbi:MAG: hypothetical protein SF182_19215 [Deltaproteobacteria bacterium]|nr:hypothetical protein [Deltaproteobacteria bacterium]
MRWMVIAALALSVAGCSTNEFEPVKASEIKNAVVLEQTTWDLGWSYSMHGMYIMGDGTVWSFQQSGNPWYPEKLKQGQMTERDMLAKHKGARQIGTVDPSLLLDMAQLIPRAKKGPITRAAGSGDGGGTLRVAYQLDREDNTYTEIILDGTGDKTATNDSAAAETLLSYLQNVQQAVGYR